MLTSIEGRFVLVVVAYFTTQVALRLLIGPALELDEAEAFFLSRHLAWGYGAQPPLYSWLQWGLFQLLGEGLLALATLKALILSGSLIAIFALLRHELGARSAAVAALSLSLLPAVVWEGQRALSHSMLALLMAVVTAAVAVRALTMGRWRDYVLLGAAVGCGTLSKLNFAIWPLGLLGAAAFLPEWRARLRLAHTVVAVLVAALVVAPAGLWMWKNPTLARGSAWKAGIEETGGLAVRVAGTGELIRAALGFLLLAFLVLGGLALGRPRLRPMTTPVVRLLGVAAVLSLVLLWVGLLLAGVSQMKGRWLLPFAWPVVPVAVSVLWPGLSERARGVLTGVTASLWLLAMVALPYASLVDPGYRGAAFGPLIERLRELGSSDRLLLVQDQWIAGNIAFHAPDLRPSLLRPETPIPAGAILVLSDPVVNPGEWETEQGLGQLEALVIRRGRTDEELALLTFRSE